ncbi:hypothetical protein OGAPHI_005717 [Ogataea philodendri]|uniref:Uncharacterized protein n=1 Tax=Ogataea philodendri TaxID=1378263 RepID=A0A9P8T205_9ASCO|nr:uncharacterized protein OGAPHI_005717 [Ogataea philodendri]KAH3662465.1 hypothetical protein OGAPHI_005717 [Ogataea philodendri]
MVTNSMSEQTILVSRIPAETIPEIHHVNGETWYNQVQKPVGYFRTPEKFIESMKMMNALFIPLAITANPTETNWQVPADETQGTGKKSPWQLSKQRTRNKGVPAVCLRRSFTDLVNISVCSEKWKQLLEINHTRHTHQVDGKHLVLQSLLRPFSMEESETVEQGHSNGHQKLTPQVRWSSEVLLKVTPSNHLQLEQEGGCKLAVFCLFSSVRSHSILFKCTQFLQNGSSFWRLEPNIVVVYLGMESWRSTNDFQHPLGRVGVCWTWLGAVLFKVVNQSLGMWTKVPKVNGLTTSSKEE